ncbi:MAG: RNA polymerase sigma factor [Flavobacteriales bacterium]|nr:RNA polymerase sigma factor [Flavobacteriales bacterium]
MNKIHNHTDESLMSFVQQGSSSALEELYKRYSKPLLVLIYRMLNGNEIAAQDLLHQVFLKIMEKPKKFDTTKKFKPWLFAVAANECRKSFRQATTENLSEVADWANADSQTARYEQREFYHQLEIALNKLNYEMREVFVLKHQQQLSIKEIATVLEIPEGTVKSRLHYALKTLATQLNEFNPKK